MKTRVRNMIKGGIIIAVVLLIPHLIKYVPYLESIGTSYIDPANVTRENVITYLSSNANALEEENYPIADIFYCIAGSLSDGSFPELYVMIKKFSNERLKQLEDKKEIENDNADVLSEHELMLKTVIEELQKNYGGYETPATGSDESRVILKHLESIDINQMPKS